MPASRWRAGIPPIPVSATKIEGGWVLSSKSQWFTYVPFDSSPRSPYGFHYTNIRWIRGRDLREKRMAGRRRNSYLLKSDRAQYEPPMKVTNSVR